MKRFNKINALQYGIAVYFIVRSMSLGIAVNSYIHIGGIDGYLSVIIGTILGFIPLYIFIKLLNYKPESNIFIKIDYLFGKYSIIINTVLAGSIFFLSTIAFWNLLNFIVSQYIFRTETIIVALIFGICFIYASRKSLNVILRVANILFYISVLIFIICLLGLQRNVNFSNLLPFLEFGIKGPILSSFAHVAYSTLPLFMLLMIPKYDIDNNNNKLEKNIIIFYILANITKFVVIFLTLSIFGIDLAKLYEFPDFLVLRRIATNGFFQRFESILATQWIFDLFIMLCISYQYIKKAYIHVNGMKYKDLFISIVIIISCIICSNYMFKNNTSGDAFILYRLPFILYFLLFLIPFGIYIKSKKT